VREIKTCSHDHRADTSVGVSVVEFASCPFDVLDRSKFGISPDILFSSAYCHLNTLLSHASTTAIHQVNRPLFHAILHASAPNPYQKSCTAKHGLPRTSVKLRFPFQLRPPSLNLLWGVSWNTSAYQYCRSSLSQRMISCTRANTKTRPSGSRRIQSIGTVVFEAVLSHAFLSSPVLLKFQTFPLAIP
jgi:hypothetical protein